MKFGNHIVLKLWIKRFIFPTIGVIIFYLIVYILGNNTRCFYRNTLGIPCPGCGLSRAYTALFRGDVLGALNYHPLFIIPIIIGLVMIFKGNSFFGRFYKSKLFWNITCISLIGLWVVRMLLYFPNKEPMIFYNNAFIPRIIRMIMN